MQGPKFKYYFKNQAGLYYFIDELDTVQVTVSKTEIVHAPKGWMEMIAGLMHNTKRKGNFKKISTPLQFVIDGKKILDYIAAYEGTQGYLDFVIEQQVPDDFSYTLFFNGTIDFEEYVFGDVFSTANIREQTLLDIIEAKGSVVYEIILDDTNAVDVQEDGINLHYKTLDTVVDGFGTSSSWNTGRHIVELIEASSENPYTKPTTRTKYTNHPGDVPGTNGEFYVAEVAGNLKIEFDYKVFVKWTDSGSVPGPGSALRYDILKRKVDGSFFNNIIYQVLGQTNIFSVSYLTGKLHHIVGSINLTLDPGDKLYLCCNVSGMNALAQPCMTTYQDSPAEFIIDSLQRSPATMHKAIRPYKLWQELIAKATNGAYGAISPFLFANNNLILIPGSSLRGDAVISIKTTLDEFLKYCWVNHVAVITDIIGQNGEIKHFADTFIDAEVMQLGEVANFEWSFSKEHHVSTIKVGYENIDFGVDNQINGKDEFNQTNHFTTGQDKLKAEYDIVSPYIASMYAHELLRVNFGNRKTTDNKSDNKVFILDAEQGTDVQWYNGPFTVDAVNRRIIIPKALSNVPPTITISNAAANNGVFTVQSVSVVGNTTTIQLPLILVLTAGNFSGLISYFDAAVYQPRRPAFVTVTGLLDPASAFNIEISPKHLLLLHAAIISAGVYNSTANAALDTLKFQSGDKNVLLSVSYDNVAFVTENADELLSLLPQPHYIPVVFTFETDYRSDIYTFMQGTNKYRYISFTWKGINLSGYVLDITNNPDNDAKQKWKLLSTATPNILNLI